MTEQGQNFLLEKKGNKSEGYENDEEINPPDFLLLIPTTIFCLIPHVLQKKFRPAKTKAQNFDKEF